MANKFQRFIYILKRFVALYKEVKRIDDLEGVDYRQKELLNKLNETLAEQEFKYRE